MSCLWNRCIAYFEKRRARAAIRRDIEALVDGREVDEYGYDTDGLHIIATDIFFRTLRSDLVKRHLWKYCNPDSYAINPDYKLPCTCERERVWRTYKWRLLHVAVERGVVLDVERLIECKADVNVRDAEGVTPLLIACEKDGNHEIIELLLRNGADKNCVTGPTDLLGSEAEQWTALDVARKYCLPGTVETIEELFAAYSPPEAPEAPVRDELRGVKDMACSDCMATGKGAECTHRQKETPPWKSSDRQKML